MISAHDGPSFGSGPAPTCDCGADHAAWTRRGFLKTTAAGAGVSLIAGLGAELAQPVAARAQTEMTPDEALAELREGNRRFVKVRMRSFKEDLAVLRDHTAPKQEPFAQLLSCADSRVPVELVFDQSLGRLFVTRVAGNIATSELIASIEYGVVELKIPAIMVLGHSGCGAVKASIAAGPVLGQISGLYRYIRPAVDRAGPDVEAVVKANAKIQARLLRESSPVIAKAIKDGKLKVVAAYYDLASGKVTELG